MGLTTDAWAEPALGRVGGLVGRVARRRIVMLTAGAIAAQGVALLAAPFLARIYSPADFGAYGVAMAAIGVAASLATMRYSTAIALPVDDRDAAVLTLVSIAASVGVAVATGVALYAALPLIAPTIPEARPVVAFCAAISVFALGMYQVTSALATRRADVTTISLSRFTQSGSIVFSQLALGLLGSPLGLIVGDALGRIVGLFGTVRVWRQWLPRMGGFHYSLGPTVRYKNFPLAAGPAALLNVLTLQVPTLAVVALYGASSGGQFLLVQRVAGVPLAVIAVSVAQDFLVTVIERGEARADGLRRQTEVAERRLLLIGAPFVVLAAVLAPIAFPVVFGPDWTQAGVIFSISSPLYLVQLASSPLGAVYDVLERQDLVAIRETIRLGLIATAVGLCVLTRPSLEAGVALLTAASVAGYIVYHALASRALSDSERQKA